MAWRIGGIDYGWKSCMIVGKVLSSPVFFILIITETLKTKMGCPCYHFSTLFAVAIPTNMIPA